MSDAFLGIDVGTKRIGVASAIASVAVSVGVVERSETAAAQIAALAAQRRTTHVVVGLPLTLRGEKGPAAQDAEAFAAELEREGLDVVFYDERLTTVQADRALRDAGTRGGVRGRRVVIDQVAAQVILQSWLDAQSAGT